MRLNTKTVFRYKVVFPGIAILILAVVIFLVYDSDPRINFAKCLTDKNAKMFGTDWCPYCQNQKKIFGETFQYINYINCDFNQKLCQEKSVRVYPVWYIGEEAQPPGIKTYSQLAELTGCPIPLSPRLP